MKILLAIDGSDFSRAAVKELAKMPLPNNSEVSVINVYEHPAMSTPELVPTRVTLYNYYEDFITNAQKIGENIVSEAVKVLKEKMAHLLLQKVLLVDFLKRKF